MRRRFVIAFLIALAGLLAACEKSPAQKELARMNVKYNKTEFLKRVKESDQAVVKLFLAAGMSPNSQDKQGVTALMHAAYEGNIEMVKLLVEYGADVNAQNGGAIALNSAAGGMANAEEGDHAEVIRFLVENGADVNAQPKYRGGDLGMTALMDASHAGDIDIVRFLLERGANVNAEAQYRRTALMEAVQYAPVEVVQLLLEHGANPNVEMEAVGGTALTLAENVGRPEIVKLLKESGARR